MNQPAISQQPNILRKPNVKMGPKYFQIIILAKKLDLLTTKERFYAKFEENSVM